MAGQRVEGQACSLRAFAAFLLIVHTTLAGAVEKTEPSENEINSEFFTVVTEEVETPNPPPMLPRPWDGDLLTRSQLTGDWFGSRDRLADSGVTVLGDITQYYQGVAAGGIAQQFKYGLRGDYLMDFDTRKMGLWDGGHLDLRGESRVGQDCNQIDGVVALSNFAMALPLLDQDVTALTGVQYTQDFSDDFSVFMGKLDILDGTPSSYARGMRLNYFWNAAMQSNLTRNYLIPSTLGVGFTVRREGEPIFNFYLTDTHYTPTTTGLSTLFANGVLLFGEYRQRTNWFSLPGNSSVGFLYSTATRTALDANPYLLLKIALSGEPLPTKDRSWTATYRFDQVVWADAANPNHSWTVRSDLGITDGSPNPIRWFANLSLLGNGPFSCRANDTVGIGYYHLGVSDLPIFTLHGIGAEDGVELFYNAAITPWFHVTPDLQVLDPAQRQNATAILVGLRARLSF